MGDEPNTGRDQPAARGRDWAQLLSLAFVGLGLLLRAIQYFADRSQWTDETMLSTNIVDRSLHQLMTGPLTLGQSAPLGFLAVEKLLTLLMGPSDMALRLFPFIATLAGLVAFHFLTGRVLQRWSQPLAVALFALAAPLISYAGQVKQYASDVAIVLLLLLMALPIQQRGLTRRQAGWAAAAGFVAAWFSQGAVLTLAGLSVVLLWGAWRQRRSGLPEFGLQRVLPVAAIWMIGGLAASAVAWLKMSPAMRDYLHRFWSPGFMPRPLWSMAALQWPVRALGALFGRGSSASLNYLVPPFYVVLSLVGLFLLARRIRARAALVLSPLVVTFAAAVLHQYPFYDRLILFLVPIFLLGLAEAIGCLVGLAQRRVGPVLGGAVLLLGLPLAYPVAASPPPYGSENIKPVLRYLREHRQAGDPVYVYHGTIPAFEYYAPRLGFGPAGETIIGPCHRGNTRLYLGELDRFRGQRRVWLLFAHSVSLYDERGDILRYLDAIGARREQYLAPSRGPARTDPAHLDTADTYLYDLSDPARLALASAATFPLRTFALNERLGCN